MICSSLLLLSALYASSAQLPGTDERNSGDESLLNGSTLDGWIGDGKRWTIQSGTLTGTSEGKIALALVVSGREFGDFELRFDLRVKRGVGIIQMRSRGEGPVGIGLEVGASVAQWLVNGAPFVVASSVQPGTWNTYRIVAKGSTFDVFVNGRNPTYTVVSPHSRDRGTLSLVMPAGSPSEIDCRSIWLKVKP